jgi:hypothetical protein
MAISGKGSATVNVNALVVPKAVVAVTVREPSAAFTSIAKVAVKVIVFTTTTLLIVMPGNPPSVVLPVVKFVPEIVTLIEDPLTPMPGAMLVNVGVGGNTVKVTGADVPPAVVIVTSRGPTAASASTVNIAVPLVPLVTYKLEGALTPVPLMAMAGSNRFVPVNVTGKLLPSVPWTTVAGLMPVSVGGNGMTEKTAAVEEPPGVVIVTFCKPGEAPNPIVKVAVAVAVSMRVMLLTAISVPTPIVMGA